MYQLTLSDELSETIQHPGSPEELSVHAEHGPTVFVVCAGLHWRSWRDRAMGKTGKFLCSDWIGPENKPVMVIMGKLITGGAYPAPYILSRDEIVDFIGGYESVATFGMALAAIAATRATLKIMDEENLVDRATWTSDIWTKEAADWNFPLLDYVTNRGADVY
ncbi:hypothetical protein IFM58399_05574 [Aspergillus lentulus]|uniref:uncharacterized protein n=1 Tax=Aspergillus lentulus TaxID=293939 RepID=UPI001395BCB1|nr:uncharacterized protein IFM58399_05574 [Aspergillus lentulus]GFF39429.1 hypothetical protein IFM58399_05574 [Aspergillus lentulus]